MCRPAPFDLEDALLSVASGDPDYRFTEIVHLLAYFRGLAEAGNYRRLLVEVLVLTEVPCGV